MNGWIRDNSIHVVYVPLLPKTDYPGTVAKVLFSEVRCLYRPARSFALASLSVARLKPRSPAQSESRIPTAFLYQSKSRLSSLANQTVFTFLISLLLLFFPPSH